MNIYIYDIEVFVEDWVVVFRNINDTTGHHIVIHNNNYQLKDFLSQPDVLIGGFNNKHYDDWIIQSMLKGANNTLIKQHNDFIIGGGNGWEFPFVQFQRRLFKSFDLRDDLDRSLSLKAIEGYLNLNIVESEIDFDIDRKLTDEELAETIRYCKYDVDSTLLLYKKRHDYIESKRIVGKLKGIDEQEALKLTNAKLSAVYLDAKKTEWSDERDYAYPTNLRLDLIPDEILNFFNQIRNMEIPDKELFKKKLKIDVGGCPCVYAWGGVHGAIKNYKDESTDDYLILNFDVASLYPNSMINFGYCSRNIPDAEAYKQLVKTRLKAKREGDKATADALKLVINTTYGAMLDRYNDLYDPKMGRSVCITNQLAMTDLAVQLITACSTFKIINFNTDGIMFGLDKKELNSALEVIHEWENRTGFELEEDNIKRIIQKDVNNYIEVKTNGNIKAVGDYVKLYNDDSFKSNQFKGNNLRIIHKAIVEFFVNDTPVETTINNATNIFDFQMIAKTGATYKSAFHEINGEKVGVQKVNRVYATTDTRYGTIKKLKASGQADKVSNVPDHCIIDNDNRLTLNDIDKQFYIDLANKRINDYLGIKAGKKRGNTKMATKTTESKNIYKKIMEARTKFLAMNVKKTGKNTFAGFKYFELADIVPPATTICNELGLLSIVSFNNEAAQMTVVNLDEPDEQLVFSSPMRTLTVKGMNEIQALGGVETYQRRYLYMIFLDIIENDAIDATGGADKSKTSSKKSNKPASESERKEAKDSLTDKDGNASDLQVKAIKKGLKKIRDRYMNASKEITDDALFEKYEPYIKEVLAKVKKGLSKTDAENLLIEVGKKIEE